MQQEPYKRLKGHVSKGPKAGYNRLSSVTSHSQTMHNVQDRQQKSPRVCRVYYITTTEHMLLASEY